MMTKSIMVALLGMGMIGSSAVGEEVARPGTVNYVEGAAYLEGQQVNARDVGSLDLSAGQVLSTAAGKAEVLLTPGVFLRLDDNSAVKMISPDLAMTQVELDKGRAAVEVDQIYPQNHIQIVDAGVTTQIEKPGFYEFDASKPMAMVFKGKAEVELGETRTVDVKDHHELALAVTNVKPGAKEKAVNFDAQAAQDELYNWSSLRSQYLAEANNQIAGEYAAGPGFYPGWYWNPYGWGYTFIGGGPFYSPFGFGFYPFGWGGFYGGYYGRGFYGHPHGYIGGGFGGGFHGGGRR